MTWPYITAAVVATAGLAAFCYLVHDGHPWMAVVALAVTCSVQVVSTDVKKDTP